MQTRISTLCLVLMAVLVSVLMLPPPQVSAQEEVASALRRYKDREASTGYYEEYEVRPRRQEVQPDHLVGTGLLERLALLVRLVLGRRVDSGHGRARGRCVRCLQSRAHVAGRADPGEGLGPGAAPGRRSRAG